MAGFFKYDCARTLLASVALATLSPAGIAFAATPAETAQAIDSSATETAKQRLEARKKARREQAAERRRQKAIRNARRTNLDTTTYRDADGADIIVVGIRGSVESARNRKRQAKQIVDVVVAEDVGKLPDNNVPEALARVTGVNIERFSGRGQNVTIRGLAGVQTTINGKDAPGAPGGVFAGSNDSGVTAGRAMNVADIPADLVKSIEVYKTRTADQIEGGIAGTVNVELRRPLDLKKGLTVAGSAKGSYAEVGKLWSPNYTALAGYRFSTGIGEMGFLLNAAYSKGRWYDVVIDSESPTPFRGQTYDELSPAIRDRLIVPFKVKNIVNTGSNNQRSLNAVYHWAPSDNLNFVLEGSYFKNRGEGSNASYEMQIVEPYYRVSNPEFNDKGGVTAITLTNPLPGENYFGLRSYFGTGHDTSENRMANFETHWHGGIANIDLSFTYNKNQSSNQNYSSNLFYPGVTSATITFNSGAVPGGGPFISAAGLDPTDPDSARIGGFHDGFSKSFNTQYAAQGDLSLNLGGENFLRSAKLGYRFYTLKNEWSYAYRDAFLDEDQPGLDGIPGVPMIIRTPQVEGGQALSFASLDPVAMARNWSSVRQLIVASPNVGYSVGGREASNVADAWGSDNATTETGSGGNSRENQFAAYAMVGYAFKLGFRFDGNVGLRYVNTWGDTFGIDAGTRTIFDKNGNFVRNENYNTVTRLRGNTSDLLPSAYLTAHFTDKLQLRMAYSYNVQRPSFWDLRSTLYLDAPQFRGNGGNPNLEPIRTADYNASLEWYFGQLGSLTINGFIKNQSGFIYDLPNLETISGYSRRFTIYRPRNAGSGTTRGIESALTTSFGFITPALKPLGLTANFTWLPTADQQQPVYGPNDTITYVTGRAAFSSKYTYNLIGLYDVGWLSARVAYNWRSSYRQYADFGNPQWVPIWRSISRLDAAINYTPYKWVTYTIEAQNLTSAKDRRFFGEYDIPVGLLQQGRTIQFGVRARF